MFFEICGLRDRLNGDGKSRAVLADQILWLISLRWMTAVLVLAGALLGCNCAYTVATRGIDRATERRRLILAIVQIETDLLALTVVLFFSGGVVNPFFLFYVFHVIIATIILPRPLSFVAEVVKPNETVPFRN